MIRIINNDETIGFHQRQGKRHSGHNVPKDPRPKDPQGHSGHNVPAISVEKIVLHNVVAQVIFKLETRNVSDSLIVQPSWQLLYDITLCLHKIV